jgi:hypothetical protein
MKPYNKFKSFQIRWKEKMGKDKNDPYLIRWTFIFFNYSIRIHKWIRSDDKRFFHDHSCNLVSMILKGWYYNVIPVDPENPDVNNCKKIRAKAWKPWYANAKKKHYLEIPKEGAWTILFCGRPYHKWGFYVKGKRVRPLKYFYKYGMVNE